MEHRHVCSDCFGDESIKQFVRDRAASTSCDFCARQSTSPTAAPWEAVVAFIREGLESWWTTDLNDLPIEPFDEEGTPLLPSYDTRWLLEGERMIARENAVPSPIGCEAVLEALEQAIQDVWYDQSLTDKELFGALVLQWSDFEYRVQRRSRFFFSTPLKGDPEIFESDQFPTADLLDELGSLVRQTNLVMPLPSGTSFFRARQHRPEDHIKTGDDLGPPPFSKAHFSNRMSPAGIVMFYGAKERETALHEVCDVSRIGETELAVGRFKTAATFKVVDLTRLPALPSIFDRNNRAMIFGIRFVHRFVEELKRPIIKDGREHVEYVPTQVVTEYFRHAFVDKEGEPVQGILYPSSVANGGICCVLFFEADQCTKQVILPQLKPRTLQMNFVDGSIEHWRWSSTREFFARR